MRKLNMDELDRLTPEAFKKARKTPLILVLDNVRSALNVGSAFRTADAFALEKIYLCGITAKPPHREILKTALGATETVEWEYMDNTLSAVQTLKSQNVRVIAVEQASESRYLQDFQPVPGTHRYAVIFGNEVNGVQEEVMQEIDDCLEIPQYGTKHSLNIAVSIGIVVWHLFQQLKTL